MAEAFVPFCEMLWRGWLQGTLDLPSFVRSTFDLEAAPEPYLAFGAGAEPLLALTTNPGATMDHQRRAAVQAGESPLNATGDYASAACALGAFYESNLTGAARRRIGALRTLSSRVGLQGVLQVEVCPFHSSALAHKDVLMQESTHLSAPRCRAIFRPGRP